MTITGYVQAYKLLACNKGLNKASIAHSLSCYTAAAAAALLGDTRSQRLAHACSVVMSKLVGERQRGRERERENEGE